jgi:hypothetical protein
MKRLFISIACSLCITGPMQAQEYLWSPDSLAAGSPNFAMNRYNQLLGYHDQLMYVTFPLIYPIATRNIPLLNGEGKDGYWMEGNFTNRFIVHKGKYYNPKWLQRLRFTFDASLTPRLTRDESNPLLPSDNKFGFGIDYLISRVSGLLKDHATPVWLTVQLHHHSNGQADSFYIADDGLHRNNYRSGDFSTNYVRTLLNVAHMSSEKSIFTTTLGWQKEIDLKGPFGMSPELYNNYGKNRLLFAFQWLQVSKLILRTPISQSLQAKAGPNKIAKRRQFSFRTELQYIVGNLNDFPHERKYRLGWHNYITYMPSITNEVGFMLHTFAGRDYLNIRFDDVVFIGEAGLFLRINKK